MKTKFSVYIISFILYCGSITANSGDYTLSQPCDALRPRASAKTSVLEPALKNNALLDKAMAEIAEWKSINYAISDNKTTDNPFTTLLQKQAQYIYNKYRLYELPSDSRLLYCKAVFDNDKYEKINKTINDLYEETGLKEKTQSEITPGQYYLLANMLSEAEGRYTTSENHYIRFCVSLIFDVWNFETRMLEQLYIIDEIDKELSSQGTGNLPVIATMQDLHGGTRRAMSLTAFILGAPDNVYDRITSFEDFKGILRQYNIETEKKGVRFIGYNDKYDRGSQPEQAYRFVRWLRESGKAKPFIGNHEFWRTMSVLGIHLISDSRVDFEKNHGIGYWSKDSFRHAGWGDIELECLNEKRFNYFLGIANDRLKLKNLKQLKPINLTALRDRFTKELKALKNINSDIRSQNELNKNNPEYRRKNEVPLPDIFSKTLSYLRDKKKEYNDTIRSLNNTLSLDIPYIDFSEVNLENYRQDTDIIESALWELKNFRLFYVDILGNLFMHSIIPIDYRNNMGFEVEYKGLKGLPALELMSEEVRVFFENMDTIPDTDDFRDYMWDNLGEIFTIINSWYSDKTAHAKVVSEKQFLASGGLAALGKGIISRTGQVSVDRQASVFVFWGHNERKKFTKLDKAIPWAYLYPDSGTGIIHTDFEMSEGYLNKGAIVTLFWRGPDGKITGLKKWGYASPDSSIIEDLTMHDIEGISPAQLSMLEELTDGVSFLKWYFEKAVKRVLREAQLLKSAAVSQGRHDKVKKADNIINVLTNTGQYPNSSPVKNLNSFKARRSMLLSA